MTVTTEIITDEQNLAGVVESWDDLCQTVGAPFSAPAWALAWWRHLRPPGSALRVVVARDGGRLVGSAPLWALDGEAATSAYELLGGRLSSPVGPIAVPGREPEVATALATALAGLRPRLSMLWLEDRAGPDSWARRLAAGSPGRGAWLLEERSRPLPSVSLGGYDGYEAWIAGRSSKFRQESRRLRRRLDDAGACFVLAGVDDVERAMEAFERLHGDRWRDRGGSNALNPALPRMFADVARDLLPSGRLRIFMIEVDDEVIAVNILMAAGEEVSGWNSGFDGEWAKLSPSLELTLHALADSMERGESRFSLGPGSRDYKTRLADEGDDRVAASWLVPRGRTYPRARVHLMRRQLRMLMSRHLSTETKSRLRRLSKSSEGRR